MALEFIFATMHELFVSIQGKDEIKLVGLLSRLVFDFIAHTAFELN